MTQDTNKAGNKRGISSKQIGQHNNDRVRDLMLLFPGITAKEITVKLGLGRWAVNNHMTKIRESWRNK